MSRGVRPLDGTHANTPGSSYCFGLLVTLAGEQHVCEATGGSVGPYGAYRYTFIDCLNGQKITLEGNRRDTPQLGEWRPIMSRDRLKRLTGLQPPTLRDGSIQWEGARFTKERRNPIMRGLCRLCTDHPIACTHVELRSILLNEDPQENWMSPRYNNIRDLAERVADTVDGGHLALTEAISHHYQRDLAMTPGWCWHTSERAGRRLSWCHPAARDADLLRLGDAGGLPDLLAGAEQAVQTARDEIAREITQARLDAAGGALQEALFTDATSLDAATAVPASLL